MLKTLLTVSLLGALTALAQETENAPSFEVASVKANLSFTGPSAISGATPGRFTASNTPLRFIILYAYRLLDNQLTGAPDWTSSDSFDIAATYPPGNTPTDEEVHGMVRKLLSERFGLMVHREQREQPMYSLVLATKTGRLGKQLHRSDVNCEQWLADKRPQTDAGGPSPVTPSGKRPACMMIATRRFLTGGTRTIAHLAVTLQSMVGRPVVDRTGLTGAFDMDLQWDDKEGPSIFTALQEQLGLKLDSGQDRVDTLVVDHVQKPAAN